MAARNNIHLKYVVCAFIIGCNITGMQFATISPPLNAAVLDAGRSTTGLGWMQLCQTVRIPNPSANGGETIDIHCNVNGIKRLDYRDVRKWSKLIPTSQKVSINIVCRDEGSVVLPWPIKAENVLSLSVHGCRLLHYFSEVADTSISAIRDELKVLRILNCTIVSTVTEFFDLIEKLDNMTGDAECGQLTIQELVSRNIEYEFLVSAQDAQYLATSDVLFKAGNTMMNRGNRVNYHCPYENMRYLDESMSDSRSSMHWKLLTEFSDFPVLKSYNLSYNLLPKLSAELQTWWNYFPVLTLLDLSHNRLQEIEFHTLSPSLITRLEPVTVDFRFNQIWTVSPHIATLLRLAQTVIVDVRNNPIHCDCAIIEFRNYLTDMRNRYPAKTDIFTGVSCASPVYLAGRSLLEAEMATALVC